MERQTFILKATKPYRHFLKLFIKNTEGKTDQRIIPFTTEHLVNERERVSIARKKHAEYSTSNENVIDALFRDTGYGKVFYLKGDEAAKLKREPFKITPVDAKKIALSNLFNAAGLEFDSNKSIDVLNEEYNIFITAKSGVKINQSTATHIEHTPVNVEQSMSDQADSARKMYEEEYGEPIPEEFKNDISLLSAIPDPGFNAKKWVEERTSFDPEELEKEDTLSNSPEELQKVYLKTFGVNVANVKKNDVGWMKEKIKEKLGQ